MKLIRYVMLPFSLMSATFFGYDEISAAMHGADLQRQLNEQAAADTPSMRGLQPAERVRTALRAEEKRARDRGETYVWKVVPAPDKIDVDVKATYRTKIAHFVGKPELPVDFTMSFGINQR